jgi:hypothetical protein
MSEPVTSNLLLDNLRAMRRYQLDVPDKECAAVLEQAADEIERLRAELKIQDEANEILTRQLAELKDIQETTTNEAVATIFRTGILSCGRWRSSMREWVDADEYRRLKAESERHRDALVTVQDQMSLSAAHLVSEEALRATHETTTAPGGVQQMIDLQKMVNTTTAHAHPHQCHGRITYLTLGMVCGTCGQEYK